MSACMYVFYANTCDTTLGRPVRTCHSTRDHPGSHRRMMLPRLRVDTHARGDQTVWQRVLDARVLIAVGRVDDGTVERVHYSYQWRFEAVVDGVWRHPLRRVVASLRDDADQTWGIALSLVLFW